jgi:SAM-dependent methyltransferase
MKAWAEWLVAQGRADAEMVAEAERVLEAAALRPGDTVLDLGAGLGLLTLAAHDRIGDGWVIAVDPSVGALEELLRLAHRTDANGIMYLVGDPEVLPLPNGSIDAVVLGSGLGQVADVELAAAELARVLRPGGRLSLREPLEPEWSSLAAVDWSPLGPLGDRVAALPAEPGQPGRHLDAARLAATLAGAGFVEVATSVDERTEDWLVEAGSIDARLDARDGAGLRTIRERWQAAFAPDEVEALLAHLRSLAGSTIALRRPRLVAAARRP